jgi:hypothetical protein
MSHTGADTREPQGKPNPERPELTRRERLLRELDEGIAESKRLREEAEYWGRVARERGE